MRARATSRIDDIPDATPMLDHFGRHLARLLETATRHAQRVVLVRQPWLGGDILPEEEAMMWNFGLGRPYREEVTRYFTARAVDRLMTQVDARAAAVAERAGVQHVDLLHRLSRSRETFYDYLPFTPAGAEAVGRLVAEAVMAGR
jgi:hypothetical protein